MKFDKNKFERLARQFSEKNNCISIFIPTERAGDGQAAKIRFKNQLKIAVEQLMDNHIMHHPMNQKEAHLYLSKAYELLDDDDFWLHQSDGLAVFVGKEQFEHYAMPIHFKEFTYVDNVFYLRPMLPAITDNERFFILALSQNEVRFFEGSRYSITPVIIEDLVPESMKESLAAVDVEFPVELQTHSGGGKDAYFHGQGGKKDGKTDRIVDYLRMVDNGLMEMLHDENVPMIIAAVDHLVPIYKEISDYSNILDQHISGNPEKDDPVLLHEKAWIFMQKRVEEEQAEKVKEFQSNLPKDKASLALNDIVPAALNGKVATLFIDKNAAPHWGTYDETSNAVLVDKKQNKHNSCLLNFAAVSTYLQGGKVYNVDRLKMPHSTGLLNAIYRY